VLALLKERPMTGKEIMEETGKRSGGAWRPSPGLVYPLLGKLLSQGLIEEVDGRYRTTEAGTKVLESYERSQDEFDRRIQALVRLGSYGKFVALDMVDRLVGIMNALRDDISNLTAEQREKYMAFLRSELRKLEELDRRARAKNERATGSK
jgi:DNA-binding PadR family transcriptional regulator